MSKSLISRRQALTTIAGAGAAGIVGGSAVADTSAPKRMQLDLSNSIDLAVARQKVIGSVAKEAIHSLNLMQERRENGKTG